MSKSINGYKTVIYVRNVPKQEAAGNLVMLAYKYESVFNLLYDKKDGAPYVVIYTNNPDEIIKTIGEHKLFDKYRDGFDIHIVRNRHFKEEV